MYPAMAIINAERVFMFAASPGVFSMASQTLLNRRFFI
jgi:hypothetical protein